ncbi:hypothetical protein EUTSA_v10029519mg, partial [Eutrema salsugineum]
NFTAVFAKLSSILTLTGFNYKEWKSKVKIVLGCMDLDLALRMEQPTSPTDTSTAEYKAVHENWERSNRISLMIILDTIPETFRGNEKISDLKQFLAEMDLRFASSVICSKFNP